jgi:hypothetical protein
MIEENYDIAPEKINLAQARFAKFHLPVIIRAAITVVVICIVREENLFTMALWTSTAIVVFWLLGNIVRYYLYTTVFPEYEADIEPEEFFEETDEDEQSEEAQEPTPDTLERE